MSGPFLPRPLLAVLSLTLLPVCGSSSYLQKPGYYELTVREVLRDDCDLLSPGTPLHVKLQVAGDRVALALPLHDANLVGFYVGGQEAFWLDGSVSDVPVTPRGQRCVVDQVTVSLEGITRCATVFDGTLLIRYESPRQPACLCEVQATFEAVQDSALCAATP